MIVCVGDGHVHDDTRLGNWRVLVEYIRREMPSEVIFSELIDPWADDPVDIAQTQTYGLLYGLCSDRARRGLATRIVLGNHDWEEKEFYLNTLPCVEVCRRYENREFIFEHGWQADWTWNIIAPAAFWVADHCPSLMLPIYRLVTRDWTPGQEKPEPVPYPTPAYKAEAEDWNLHVAAIHDRYRLKAKEKMKPYIIWHTHCPWRFDGLIADCGDFIDSYSWLEIRGKTVHLCALEDLVDGLS